MKLHSVYWLIAVAWLGLPGSLVAAQTSATAPKTNEKVQPVAATSSEAILFLTPEQARSAIVDESLEPYFSLMQPREMSLKTAREITGKTIEEQRVECRRRYQAAVREFSPDEKQLLLAAVAQAQPELAAQYPVFAAVPWSFIKLSSQLEGGFPYTHGRSIVLPDRFLLEFKKGKDQEGGAAMQLLCMVLVHEKLHVLQRTQARLFEDLYVRVWGFQHAEQIESCPWLRERQIINPDAVDGRWILPITREGHTHYIMPCLVLSDQTGSRLTVRDLRPLAVTVEAAGKGFRIVTGAAGVPEAEESENVPEYVRLFPGSDERFCPAEAAADLFSQMVISDLAARKAAGDQAPQLDARFDTLRQWFRLHLKSEDKKLPAR